MNSVLLGDSIEIMKSISDQSIDMILTDPPYGITQNSWDKKPDFEKLWEQYLRIIKNNSAIVIFGKGIFSAELICSRKDLYKYTLIWSKNKVSGHLNAKIQPLSKHEDIMIFGKNKIKYNPQKTFGHDPVNSYTHHIKSENYGEVKIGYSGGGSTERYPTTILNFNVLNNDDPNRIHPTQKPENLGEYLIKTYSNEGDLILDNYCGSGAFLLAAKSCGRKYIGIDNDENMINKVKWRLKTNDVYMD